MAGKRTNFFARRDVAQSGSALEWGSRGRRFKSFHPDHNREYPKGEIEQSISPFSYKSYSLFKMLFT